VLVVGFPAGPWGTNCYVVAPAAGEQCVIVDPGKDACPASRTVREHGSPVAVLLTHGHIDHVWWSSCRLRRGIPAYIHPDDWASWSPERIMGRPATARS
jgi:glyoxylase-like metal-dependent hydrolase (beta-lactamase superfamily II)